jgi:hypothetical protein
MDNRQWCSLCRYSIPKANPPGVITVPSIHTCYNITSEYYMNPQAWCSTCDKFEPKKDLDEN